MREKDLSLREFALWVAFVCAVLVGVVVGCSADTCNYESVFPSAKEDYDRMKRTVEALRDRPDQTVANYDCEADWLSPEFKRIRFKYVVSLTVADVTQCIYRVTVGGAMGKIFASAPEPNAVAACMKSVADNFSRRKITIDQASNGMITDPQWQRFKDPMAIAEGPDCREKEWLVLKETARDTTTAFVAATIVLAGRLVQLVKLTPAPALFILKPTTPAQEACFEGSDLADPPKVRCADTSGCPDAPEGAEPPDAGGVDIPPGTAPSRGDTSTGEYP